jgi:hypothetical protein
MDKINPKICVIITRDGVESITVHASDAESRRAGYNTCAALEPTFAEVNKIVGEMFGDMPDKMES